ncbi:TRAP transporter small permease [Ottowia sp.]|uniref:TRAP transporter small permease n=1 Tax=Ottowia sp. TaxID=1898956 RepID=UPI002C4FA3B2|nr:TRAP transporter small permease [Ottowia sp.]HRN76104.1 TRAP transporter small permease [Ottowia sp.]HRQ03290.1 TRAP transporter small permease [Ottowia sp.]
MRALFLSIETWTTRIAMWIACLMLAIASSLAVFQIFTRFVLEQPAEWSEVLIRFSLIWMVFLGIPMAFRQGAMISVDALYRAVPTHFKRVLDLVVALAALALMLIILWWGFDYAVRGSVQTMAGLEVLSMFWAYIALPVGALFSIIAIVANYLDPRRMELETAQ